MRPWVEINESPFQVDLFVFRVQFVCNPCGNNGHSGHNGQFLIHPVDRVDTMDAELLYGHADNRLLINILITFG